MKYEDWDIPEYEPYLRSKSLKEYRDYVDSIIEQEMAEGVCGQQALYPQLTSYDYLQTYTEIQELPETTTDFGD